MLKTVDVPPELAGLFELAQAHAQSYFADVQLRPEEGTIEIGGKRYLRVRAASMSVEFFDMVRELYADHEQADRVARSLLFDLAHAMGLADARDIQSQLGITDPLERLSLGPVHFAYSGWAFVTILPESAPTADDAYLLVYEHPYSFEADSWVRAGRRSEAAVCVMNAGYSSGWCEASFGIPLVGVELLCKGRGDDCCRFIMAPPERIGERVEAYLDAHPGLREEVGTYDIPGFFREHQRAQEEARRREEQLMRAQKLDAVGRLAGGIAHDFNNLLTVILGYAEQLQVDLPDGDPSRRRANAIARAAERAAKLTQQLLTFSRKQVVQPTVLDVGGVVLGLRDMLERLVREDTTFEVLLAPELGRVRADKTQLEHVLVNLVVNARDALPGGGRVRVTVHNVTLHSEDVVDLLVDPGRYVVLEVADDGEGMDEETVERVFEPFFTTKPVGQGVGLGLATVYGVAKQSGGAVTVESAVGKGSIFRVLLPCTEEALDESPLAAAVRDFREGGSETILVAEDATEIRALVAGLLLGEGYRVLVASDGIDAVVRASKHVGPIDLVLADVVMPRMRGPEAVAQIRRTRPDVKVIYMTGHPGKGGESVELSTDDTIITKPFSTVLLLGRVRDALNAGTH